MKPTESRVLLEVVIVEIDRWKFGLHLAQVTSERNVIAVGPHLGKIWKLVPIVNTGRVAQVEPGHLLSYVSPGGVVEQVLGRNRRPVSIDPTAHAFAVSNGCTQKVFQDLFKLKIPRHLVKDELTVRVQKTLPGIHSRDKRNSMSLAIFNDIIWMLRDKSALCHRFNGWCEHLQVILPCSLVYHKKTKYNNQPLEAPDLLYATRLRRSARSEWWVQQD